MFPDRPGCLVGNAHIQVQGAGVRGAGSGHHLTWFLFSLGAFLGLPPTSAAGSGMRAGVLGSWVWRIPSLVYFPEPGGLGSCPAKVAQGPAGCPCTYQAMTSGLWAGAGSRASSVPSTAYPVWALIHHGKPLRMSLLPFIAWTTCSLAHVSSWPALQGSSLGLILYPVGLGFSTCRS